MEIKSPGRWFKPPVRAEVDDCVSLQQIEFLGAADGRPAVVHLEFVVNVLGVVPFSVQGEEKSLGQFPGRSSRFASSLSTSSSRSLNGSIKGWQWTERFG